MDYLVPENRNPASATLPDYADISNGYQSALKAVDDIVLKNYITNLSNMDIIPLKKDVLTSNIRDNVRFFKITEMVYEKEEFAPYKFASVFNTLSVTNSAIFIIIDSDGVKTDFYMGVRSLDQHRTISSLRNTLENAMKGQFPGMKTAPHYTVDEMQYILDKIQSNSISAVSCVANNKITNNIQNETFVQGLEKLTLAMQGERYTGIIIANVSPQEQLRGLRKGYESIYTQLSPFATTQINYTSNGSMNYAIAEMHGRSQSTSHTENSSESQGKTTTTGKSTSYSTSEENITGKMTKSMATVTGLLGAALAPFTGGASLIAGGVISGSLGLLGPALQKTTSKSNATSESTSNTYSSVKGFSDGTTDTTNHNLSKTEGYTKGTSQAMALTLHDKTVEDILARIDKQLKRIDEFENLGMYECAAYFLSSDQYAAEIAASTYKAIMRGENSGVEIAAINSWGQYNKEKTALVSAYIKNFMHPVFNYNSPSGPIEVTPCSLVSGNELAIHMGLPRRSVCGLPVIEHTDFGKEIVTYDESKQTHRITLGNIFNMGNISNSKVSLDINSLSMHTFVTGSTGSGKSNTVYEILRQLDNVGINYLVVEPAKGEYKNIFGNNPHVTVLGTNPDFTELLRINPFKFPKGVHVLEHIDRLVEIFNVCWPMYAAMPAVLKSAILQSYESCGWDLNTSTNRYSDMLFPTFHDLLKNLISVIKKSDYSDEIKSNYTGSLVTRIQSLTNGLNGQLFSSDEIDNTLLFDSNVIVDISRIGSLETKSLIMGLLVMRLNEHRMSNASTMNVPLRHVTVLEEAHNILKRTSTEQSSEGPNMTQKSVEMISNTIAEMRTYGEGFIIADQSPSAVDISAIRNTNTKIIMRLPDEQDRWISGKSAGLKEEQLGEIAKLPKGLAVVYQNDWVEAVLCKINKFRGEEKPYHRNTNSESSSTRTAKKLLLQNLMKKTAGEKLDLNLSDLSDLVISIDLPTEAKIASLKTFRQNGKCHKDDINSVIYDMVCNPEIEKNAEEAESIEEWRNVFLFESDSILSDIDETTQNMAIECILKEQIKRFDKSEEYIDMWKQFLQREALS